VLQHKIKLTTTVGIWPWPHATAYMYLILLQYTITTSYRKEGDKDLLATISTAVKNLSVDQITDDASRTPSS